MYTFRQARTQADYEALYKLCYRAYCVERKWLPAKNYSDQTEKDIYDRSSTIFSSRTGSMRFPFIISSTPPSVAGKNEY
ncbi:hypothetical protein GF407_11140 [candidate division KSB1 bacterium]|nr:hypothetical protein [candidate division KSB1 bacterium]